ncbi:MAG: hypothetical protein ABI459_08210, partial [Deltaproteobacteria bacterium]
FYNQIDKMIYSVSTLGMNDPAADLYHAFLCRAPQAPQITEAKLWQDVEQSKASKTVSFTYAELLDLIVHPDPQLLAVLQSQALYGRATATAQYMTYLDLIGAPAEQRDFWAVYSRGFEKVDQARGKLLLEGGAKGEARAGALDLLRQAVKDGDVTAGLHLASALLHPETAPNGSNDPTPEARAEAIALLEPLAKMGIGEALTLLPVADAERWPNLSVVAEDYADVIDARGDFEALLLALPSIRNADQLTDYVTRAATVTDCSFEQVIQFADVMGRRGDHEGFTHWSTIASALIEVDGWQMTLLGDKLRQYGDAAQLAEGYTLYEKANEIVGRTAAQRLLAIASQASLPEYDPARAAGLYVSLLNDASPDEMVKLLRRIDAEDVEIRDLVLAKVSPQDMYLKAAEGGNPVAMREYARLARASATEPEDIANVVSWMSKAANLDDAPAMLEYAQMLAFGAGVPASRDEAVVWLQKASDKGLVEANVMLQALTLAATQ